MSLKLEFMNAPRVQISIRPGQVLDVEHFRSNSEDICVHDNISDNVQMGIISEVQHASYNQRIALGNSQRKGFGGTPKEKAKRGFRMMIGVGLENQWVFVGSRIPSPNSTTSGIRTLAGSLIHHLVFPQLHQCRRFSGSKSTSQYVVIVAQGARLRYDLRKYHKLWWVRCSRSGFLMFCSVYL